MLNIGEIYREQLGTFLDAHRKVSDIVWQVFPDADHASLDDLAELRKLVEKVKEAVDIADSFFRIRMLRAKRDKWLSLPESFAQSQGPELKRQPP